jgi:heme/copper-type cytochrome/quinol oxidase subunit 3
MIRPILVEIGLFLAPFVIYAAIRIAMGAGVLQQAAWTVPRLSALAIAALVLVVGSFLMFAQFSGAPPDSTYIPAHMDGGKFIPGATR